MNFNNKFLFVVFYFCRSSTPTSANYHQLPSFSTSFYQLQSGAIFAEPKKILIFDLTFFFYTRNDSAIYVKDFGIPFFGNRQFFLKFSKICKKINFKLFLCIFSYEEVMGQIEKISALSTTYIMAKNVAHSCLENAQFCFRCFLLKK